MNLQDSDAHSAELSPGLELTPTDTRSNLDLTKRQQVTTWVRYE